MKLKGEYILKISADIYKLASSSQSKAKSSQSRLKSPTSPTSFLHESIAQHKMRTQCGKTSQTPDFGAYACRVLCVLPHLQTQIRTRSGAYTVNIHGQTNPGGTISTPRKTSCLRFDFAEPLLESLDMHTEGEGGLIIFIFPLLLITSFGILSMVLLVVLGWFHHIKELSKVSFPSSSGFVLCCFPILTHVDISRHSEIWNWPKAS